MRAQDRTIIATAIPSITNDFDSLGDVGWYGSAYLLTACGFQLLFGRIYQFYSPKWVWLVAIVLFEIGSAICGAAPNSVAFIIGRAIAGLGSAGVFSGALIIIVYAIPLHRRPIFTGSIGGVFGIASVMGPLLGGAFTENVTWRWCFYLNLPIGAVTIVIIALILNVQTPSAANLPTAEKLKQLDPIGTFFFLPSVICLLLALQWGGSTYAWSDGRIIALLVLFGVLMIAFIAVQIIRQEGATVPPRIFKQRSILAGVLYTIGAGSSMMIFVYYIPIYFQAIQGVDAVQSGIRNLALVLSLVVASLTTGILVTKIGYYTPFMIVASVIMSIGGGLLTTLWVDSSEGKWLGYQILFGFGLGMGMQQANLAAQVVLNRRDVSVGASLMVFSQSLGGAIFISVGQNILSNKLASGLAELGGINPQAVVSSGATDIRNIVPAQLLPQVLEIYNLAIRDAFYAGLAMACFTIFGALLMEWRNIKKEKDKKPVEIEAAAAAETEV